MLNVFRNFSWSTLLDLLINLISALTCIILHELSHGYVALLLGDKTAREQGRLTLNPLKHIDPPRSAGVRGAQVRLGKACSSRSEEL